MVAREDEQIDPRGAAFLQQMGAGGERRACRQDVVAKVFVFDTIER